MPDNIDVNLLRRIRAAKLRLDELRPMTGDALDRLRKYFDVELTFTSNAIEGNTLTRRETAEVIEHGITVGGKPLKDHLEAADHYAALQWMRSLAASDSTLGEDTVRELHSRIVARSAPEIAGVYSSHARRIAGSEAIFPNPVKIPNLMRQFGEQLGTVDSTPEAAFDLHYRLTAIHPFSDGNGRTARLVMNLVLIRGGYPPIAVRPEDRNGYLAALERDSVSGDVDAFQELMHRRLEATLDEYVALLSQTLGVGERPAGTSEPGKRER